MNKLLQTTLITVVLTTGAMAQIDDLPSTIEEGAIVYVNKSIIINGTY